MSVQESTLPHMGKRGDNSATWIDDGEKYAIVALSVKVDGRGGGDGVAAHLSEGASHVTVSRIGRSESRSRARGRDR